MRRSLLDTIRANPGLQAAALGERVAAKRGTIDYHLAFLERAGMVKAVRRDHKARYFLAEMDPRESSGIAVLLEGRIIEVVHAILKEPGVSQKDLTSNLLISRKIFRKYANLLDRHELIEEVRVKRLKKYYPTPGLRRLLAAGRENSSQNSRSDCVGACRRVSARR